MLILSPSSTTTTFALALFASNFDCRPPPCEPLPSSEGCGLHRHRHSSLRSEGAAAAAPPFPKGCGRFMLARRSIPLHPRPPQRHRGLTGPGHHPDDDDDEPQSPPPPRPNFGESSHKRSRLWPQRRRRRPTTTHSDDHDERQPPTPPQPNAGKSSHPTTAG